MPLCSLIETRSNHLHKQRSLVLGPDNYAIRATKRTQQIQLGHSHSSRLTPGNDFLFQSLRFICNELPTYLAIDAGLREHSSEQQHETHIKIPILTLYQAEAEIYEQSTVEESDNSSFHRVLQLQTATNSKTFSEALEFVMSTVS